MPHKRAQMSVIAAFIALSGLATAHATPAPAAEMPKTFNNEYTTRAYGITITVTHRLSDLDNGGQRLHFLAKSWVASIEEKTDFRWSDQGEVEPQHYIYKRRGLGRNRDAELTFDWDQGSVTNNVENHSWKMDVYQNVQDKLSYQVQLQKDLLAGKDHLSYQIADGGELKTYRFEVVGEEVLDTPLGKVNTIKVARSRDDSDRVTNAWLAKDWNYLLVRLQQKEDGDSHSISITKAEVNGKRIERF